MARLRLSKQALARERDQLKLYRRLLPSLDLKRRQLTVEHEKARHVAADAHERAAAFEQRIGRELPMAADTSLDVGMPVRVTAVVLREENVVGIRLPALERVDYDHQDYALLGRPAWLDVLTERMRESIELRLGADVAEQRSAVLAKAVRRVTQRVNLFERVLIPRSEHDIKRIQIYLGDLERDAVVRSKLAKAKQRHAGGEAVTP